MEPAFLIWQAFSLFINCVSPLRAVYQFGLCGGTLIVTNFLLSLCFIPAVFVLKDRGALRIGGLCAALRLDPAQHVRRMHHVHARLYRLRAPLLASASAHSHRTEVQC